MTETMPLTPDRIRQASAELKRLRPLYTAILDFYEQIFVIQKESERELNIDFPALKIGNQKFPLISLSDFTINVRESETLFKKICEISPCSQILYSGVQGLLAQLFSAILQREDSLFEKTAREYGIDKSLLCFVTYHSIAPSLFRVAEYLSAGMAEKDSGYEKGSCPICGSLPALSTLEGEGGHRFLFCSFCWHRWQSRRIACPFCENRNTEKLHYFYSEEEKEYRTDVCEACGKYIKTVDLRKIGRIFYARLEHAATLHLDMKAKDAGFETAATY